LVAPIREETEVDRTKAALASHGATLPLARGEVEIAIEASVAESLVGQRLLVVLTNELARMKGVVSRLHVVGVEAQAVLPSVPLREPTLGPGLARLVADMNTEDSAFQADIVFSPANEPAARVRIGNVARGGLLVGADAWRALLGQNASASEWASSAPYGSVLAAAIAATEVFKQLLTTNGGPDPGRRLVTSLAYSAFNYGVDDRAEKGPDVPALSIADLAVVGCGAGGSAALYVLAMQPGIAGNVALIEPDFHKLSNLNRYLMTTAADVHAKRHKLASAADHLARFAPRLHPTLYPERWELLNAHPWPFLLATVDTVEARWAIQRRSLAGAEILDAAVLDLLYGLVRVVEGGWCLECKHPYDPELPVTQRAARWGQTVEAVRAWTENNVFVSTEMIERLALTQNQAVDFYAELEGVPFAEVPRLTECGETSLRTDVPSQAPALPLATTPVGVLLAGEIAKHFVAPQAQLNNWLAHDLARSPGRPWLKWRPSRTTCPRHS
jgi:molybdopterin/thiamine biosynthesis adenylyltransferase